MLKMLLLLGGLLALQISPLLFVQFLLVVQVWYTTGPTIFPPSLLETMASQAAMNRTAPPDDLGSFRGRPGSPKRAKLDHDYNSKDNTEDQYRRRSPLRRRPRGDRNKVPNSSNQITHEALDGPRVRGEYHINDRKRQRSASPDGSRVNDSQAESRNKKSKRDRKQNPSTQIRSLRNLLGRGRLPAQVYQEKKRELAALLFDQQKEIVKNNAKKNLKRYHFIRFVERQKAARNVKKLTKLKEAGNLTKDQEMQLHEAEVDLNYALYSPLAQKYVAIYARDESEAGKPLPLARNLSRMKHSDLAILSDEQRYALEQTTMEASGLLHMADSVKGAKPPIWYVIEAKMEEGQKALEEFRDEKPKVDLNIDLVLGKTSKSTPDWLNDDGVIDPADLDSDSDEDGGVGVNDREETGDLSDGGFFEKR